MADTIPEGVLRTITTSVDNQGNITVSPVNYYNTILFSKSQVEIVDLISEGLINGLVTGKYNYSGNLGEVGWRQATFSGFRLPNGYTGIEYLRSVYLNQVPVLDDLGKFNFQNVNLSYTNGLPNGDPIRTLSPYQSVSRTIGERLRGGDNNAKFYRIFNKDCKAIIVAIKISSLSDFNQITAVTDRSIINYSIYYRPIFSNKPSTDFILGTTENVYGKVTRSEGYIRPSRINFSTSFSSDVSLIGWEIKISRTTPDSVSQFISNISVVDSITQIQENIFTFPNSAVIRQLFDAEYFSSIPERFFDVEMLKIKVPGNYDPVLRNYATSGFATTNNGWNGEFATGVQYTNNPAWCYYDLLTNKRYGLGKYVNPDFTDKWELYNIGKYCDTLVSNGEGGLEPRFTCNLWLSQREDAFKVINDMASIFRGISYYANGYIYTTQDCPKNDKWEFANANVENGEFAYSSNSKKTRYSVAIVRYNDPKEFYKPAIEYVEDFDAIRKYGIREIELSAFGCTSRGQAIRLGRWLLASQNLETENVSFTAGIEASALRPGDIFKVSDVNKTTKRYGGRAMSIRNISTTGSQVILDYKMDIESNIGYKVSFLTPTYNYNGYSITGISSEEMASNRSHLQKFNFSGNQYINSGNYGILNLYSGFNTSDYNISGYPIWMVELGDNYASYSGAKYFSNINEDYYRLINLSEKEQNKFNVEAVQYNPQKYIEIESGLLLDRKNFTTNTTPSSPTALSIDVFAQESQLNQRIISYAFSVSDSTDINTYKVYIKSGSYPDLNVPDSQYLVNLLPNNITYGNYSVTDPGDYHVRIYSSNDIDGILSPNFVSGMATIYPLNSMTDYIINSLQISNVTGINTSNANNGQVSIIEDNDLNPIFNWQVGNLYGYNLNSESLKYRVTIRPTNNLASRIPSVSYYYEVTGITDYNWQFDFDTNLSIGPVRTYQVVVEAHDDNGNTSAGNKCGQQDLSSSSWINNPYGYDILVVNNPRQNNIELQRNILTAYSGINDFESGNALYKNNAYLGPNGDISIQYTSGVFDEDLVGGYVYISASQFNKLNALTGYSNNSIARGQFNFNPLDGYIYHPTVASILNDNQLNFDNIKSGYCAISFYDSIDKALIDQGYDIASGLYLSNIAPVMNNSSIGKLNLGGSTILETLKFSGDQNPITNWNKILILASGVADNITSIVYTDIISRSNQWSS